MKAITITDVKSAQPAWFSPKNKRFFGDKSYRVLKGGVSGKYYLVRLTQAWSDMFGRKPQNHYRINRLDPKTAKILELTDDIFDTNDAVKRWLRIN